MHPINFHPSTKSLTAPGCAPLPVLPVVLDGFAGLVSCWQLSEADYATLAANGGRLYVVIASPIHPPILVTTDHREVGI